MKFQVQMKDPDTLGDAITEAVKEAVAKIPELAEEEREAVVEQRVEGINKMCGKWFKYGEYLCVEIDTDAGTCTVVPYK